MNSIYTYQLVTHDLFSSCAKVEKKDKVVDLPMLAFDCSYMVFDYGGCTMSNSKGQTFTPPKAYIKPARNYFFKYRKPEYSFYYMIKLNPYGFFQLTGENAFEYQNKYLPLSTVFGQQKMDVLYDALAKAANIKSASEIIAHFFDENAHQDNHVIIKDIVDEIKSRNGRITIESIKEKYNYSISTLNRYFKKYIGMTIGIYIRLVKFNALIRLLQSDIQLRDIILLYDFYDQAHLTRDFKKFANITPNEYKGPNFELLRQALKVH